MAELFSNNAVSTLTGSLAAIGTSLTVQAGHGARFPNPTASDFFRMVLVRKSDGAIEIVFCTVRSGDIFTITRAQESTTALAFVASDIVELRPTAGFFTSLTVTSGAIQNNQYTYDATDTGSANICIIQPSPAISAYTEGQEFWFKVGVTNTGASTLNVSALGTSPAIILPNGAALYAGALQATRIAHTIFDGTSHVLQNPYNFASVAGLVSSTHTELNYVDVATPGTVEASKAVVVNSNRDIANLRNVTMNGAFTNSGKSFIFGDAVVGTTNIEIGYTGGAATFSIIDFHTGAIAVDYDSRIIASGGNGVANGGTLELSAATILLTGTIPTVTATTANIAALKLTVATGATIIKRVLGSTPIIAEATAFADAGLYHDAYAAGALATLYIGTVVASGDIRLNYTTNAVTSTLHWRIVINGTVWSTGNNPGLGVVTYNATMPVVRGDVVTMQFYFVTAGTHTVYNVNVSASTDTVGIV